MPSYSGTENTILFLISILFENCLILLWPQYMVCYFKKGQPHDTFRSFDDTLQMRRTINMAHVFTIVSISSLKASVLRDIARRPALDSLPKKGLTK